MPGLQKKKVVEEVKESQYYGWSREDAAPLNQPMMPRRDTFLTRRLALLRYNDRMREMVEQYRDSVIKELKEGE